MTMEQEILAVMAQDLGPAAKVFLYRTCRQQLGKEPSALEKTDIPQLAVVICSGLERSLGIPLAEKVKANLLTIK
ncbi:MAG: hypothetical protein ACFCUE_01370 [Candidatus Bathyarchaeia archaeon]|jgi:hypothetical protein